MQIAGSDGCKKRTSEIIRNLEYLITQTVLLERGLRQIKEQFLIQLHAEQKEEKDKPSSIENRIRITEWNDIPQGKRFLTAKELGLYWGISHATIHNQVSTGTFPIRHKKIGRTLQFDMKEILEYLDTSAPFWERDKQKTTK